MRENKVKNEVKKYSLRFLLYFLYYRKVLIVLNFFHINYIYFIFSFTLKIKPDIRKNIGT